MSRLIWPFAGGYPAPFISAHGAASQPWLPPACPGQHHQHCPGCLLPQKRPIHPSQSFQDKAGPKDELVPCSWVLVIHQCAWLSHFSWHKSGIDWIRQCFIFISHSTGNTTDQNPGLRGSPWMHMANLHPPWLYYSVLPHQHYTFPTAQDSFQTEMRTENILPIWKKKKVWWSALETVLGSI